jgi:hypothetical protein
VLLATAVVKPRAPRSGQGHEGDSVVGSGRDGDDCAGSRWHGDLGENWARPRDDGAVALEREAGGLGRSDHVYKQRGNLPAGQWRLVRYDVATGHVTPLGETRSVDNEVEWLDDSQILYGIPRTGTEAGTSDVWELSVDGSGPTMLIPEAWSPSVVP